MAARCPAIRGLCRIRLTRLDTLGNVASDTNNSWVSAGMAELGISPEISEGDEVELKNGCGDIVAQISDEDFRKRFNLTLTMTKDEPGLREMLLGDDLVLDGTDPIGTSFADQSDEDFAPALVAIEAFAKLIDSDAQDAVRPWLYILFTASSWVDGDQTLGADFWQPTYSGKTRSNALWGNGPYGDLGITEDQIGTLGAMVQLDSAFVLPDAVCGFSHIAPGS